MYSSQRYNGVLYNVHANNQWQAIEPQKYMETSVISRLASREGKLPMCKAASVADMLGRQQRAFRFVQGVSRLDNDR
jgi:hypothetical protein